MNEDEIYVVFFEDGVVATSRFEEPGNWKSRKVKQMFVVPENTPLYRISEYFGYHKIPEEWREVKKIEN